LCSPAFDLFHSFSISLNGRLYALIQGGVGGDRIKTISYGKEKPFCTESNESCWQQNRRGHFLYEQ